MSLSSDSTYTDPVPESCQDPLDSLCWQLFDDVPVALLTIDQNLGLLSANRSFQEMTGYRPRDLIGEPVLNLIQSKTEECLKFFLSDRFTQHEPDSAREENCEFELKDAEGRMMPVELRTTLVDTDDNKLLLCSVIDVSERSRSRNALIDSQKRLREILDNTEAVVYVKDVDGRYQFVNRRFEELFNIRLDVLIGKYDYEIFPKKMAQDFRRNDIEVIDRGVTIQVKEVAPHEDGPHLYLSSKFPLRDRSGQIYATAGISTDITQMDRKERELEQLKTSLELILNSVSDGIIGTNRSGDIQYVNRAAREMFELDSSDHAPWEQVKQTLLWTSPQESRPITIQELVEEALDRKSEPVLYPVGALAQRDGTTLPVDISCRVTENEDGTVGLVVTLRDISHLRKLQQRADELRTAQIVQRQLYPEIPPRINGFQLAGTALPATQACGDYFDFILNEEDSAVVLTIGDVTGHGLGPALQMVETRAYLRAMIHQHGDLRTSITKLNEFLVDDTPEGSFISLLAARLDPESQTMQYVGAGHDAWLVRTGGQVLHLPSTGLLLGLMKESHYECSDKIPLHRGDLLLMITDGLQEALSRTGELFGTDRLLQIVQQNRERDPADLIEHLIEQLRLYVDHRPLLDDVTILAAKVNH